MITAQEARKAALKSAIKTDKKLAEVVEKVYKEIALSVEKESFVVAIEIKLPPFFKAILISDGYEILEEIGETKIRTFISWR